MCKSRRHKYFRIIGGGLRLAAVLMLCLLMSDSAFAASGDTKETEKQREQWVFLLSSPDDDSECRFFARPSLRGYDTGENTDISLNLSIGDKSYEIALYPSDTRSGWYISKVYNIAASAWDMDYEAILEIADEGSLLAEETLTKDDLSACWPEVSDGSLNLEKDDNGSLIKYEFEGKRWMNLSDSPLFEYRIDNQKNCEAVLDRSTQNIRIIQAENGGSFILAAEDPAGNRREAKVDIIVAGQTGAGLKGGIIAAIVVAVIVIAAVILKRRRKPEHPEEGTGEMPVGGRRIPEKQQRIREAKKDVDEVLERIENLVADMEAIKADMERVGRAAEARVVQEAEASAYSLSDIQNMMKRSSELLADPSYDNLKQMKCILQEISRQLQKMYGNVKVDGPKNGLTSENPKNYIDPVSRENILDSIKMDEEMAKNDYRDLENILKTLEEIAGHQERPFEKDIDIFVKTADGDRQYSGRRVARNSFGIAMQGVFSLDTLQLLPREGDWMTLPEILNHPTGIRICAIDSKRIRAITPEPVMKYEDKMQRIMDFAYDEDAVIILEDAEITLHFRG